MVIQEIARNESRARVDAPSPEALDLSIARLQGYFRRIQYPDGYWWGELESNNTMEAEYVMLSRFLGHHQPERDRHIVNYLRSKQPGRRIVADLLRRSRRPLRHRGMLLRAEAVRRRPAIGPHEPGP